MFQKGLAIRPQADDPGQGTVFAGQSPKARCAVQVVPHGLPLARTTMPGRASLSFSVNAIIYEFEFNRNACSDHCI
jgi:hypothetical protein